MSNIIIEIMQLSSTDYILLAYLNTGPVYTYRLAEILREESIDSWSKYSVPHLYYSLRRLLKNGLVNVDTKTAKSRPPQKVYSLSRKGKALLNNLEGRLDLIEADQFFPFDLLLGLSERLGIETNKLPGLIEARLEKIRKTLADVQEKFREIELKSETLGAGERIAFKHRIRFLKSEMDFYRKCLKEFKK